MFQYTEHFYKIIDFLSIYQQLIDCHLVDFISEELWDKCLPNLLRSELENVEAINAIWNQSDKITQLNDFMKTTKSLSLKACPMTMDLEDFSKLVLHVDNDEWKFNVEMKKKDTGFMKKKKFHEVEVLGNVVGQIARSTNSLVIDAGAGKAYLSTYLSDNYKLPVLAIDSSDLCHKAAIQRAEKMKKKGNKSTSLVKYVVTKIDDNTDYNTMVKENFPNWNLKNNLILTGLHTCGSLVHSLMKMFLKSNDFQIICIVPCCYHLVNESLSKQINFSKNARMLAQQCIERTAETKSLPPSLFYRAVLQVLLNSMGLRDVRIGRGGPMYDFPTYAKWALMKIGIDKTKIPSMENLQELYRSYEHYKLKFDIFQMLRISLSPVLEAAIILDRVIYLQNSKQCSKSIILRLFDPVLSPRHYAIVAIK